jgi:hypothetical protein
MEVEEISSSSIRSFRYGYLVFRHVTKCNAVTTSPYLRPQDSSSPNGRHLTPRPLAWSDGRCVQEFPSRAEVARNAGTYSPRHSETRILGIPGSRG